MSAWHFTACAVPAGEAGDGGVEREDGLVAEVGLGGGEVEPVGGGEFAGDEAGHGGFAGEAEAGPGEFCGHTGGVGQLG